MRRSDRLKRKAAEMGDGLALKTSKLYVKKFAKVSTIIQKSLNGVFELDNRK